MVSGTPSGAGLAPYCPRSSRIVLGGGGKLGSGSGDVMPRPLFLRPWLGLGPVLVVGFLSFLARAAGPLLFQSEFGELKFVFRGELG